MGNAKTGDVVKVHYKAKTNEEVIFDTKMQEPLKLTIGNNEVIPAFENALLEMSLGDHKTISVPAEEAFGPYLDELIITIEKSKIPPNIELKIGQTMQIQQPNGEAVLVTLVGLNEITAKFDANHPLAGKDLIFDIELLEIANS